VEFTLAAWKPNQKGGDTPESKVVVSEEKKGNSNAKSNMSILRHLCACLQFGILYISLGHNERIVATQFESAT
jgi:hypothetical protein